MRFALRRLMPAIPWFAFAAFVLVAHLHNMEVMRMARAQGHFVCPMCMLGPGPCAPAALGGIATLFGQWRAVAMAGIPAVRWVAFV